MEKGQYYIGSSQVERFKPIAKKLSVPKIENEVNRDIFMYEVIGKKDGPTFGLTGLVHGDEHTSIEIIRRVLNSIDPNELMGRVRSIPVVSPLAFEAINRDAPLDGWNMNRVFPGDINGTFTQRRAAVISDEFLKGLDYLIDIHTGGRQGWIDFAIALGDRNASLAFGMEHIHLTEGKPNGSMIKEAVVRGAKDSTIIEFGGLDITGPIVDKGVRCVYNIMRYWGLLPGDPVLPARQYIYKKINPLLAKEYGLLFRDPENAVLGKILPKDALLAHIVDPYTFEVMDEIRTTYDRNLVFHIPVRDGLIIPGDWTFQYADMATTEIVNNK